jgi:hypothetical protein
MYSGHVAGATYARAQIPSRTIILCPNHTGLGPPLSIMRAGSWQTPFGEFHIDTEMCDALMAAHAGLQDDMEAHRLEHALEVQLPFLQYLRGPHMRFVPITVGISDWEGLEELGRTIGETIANVDRSTLIIASSDMNHYESDPVTRMKDAKAIAPMLKLDARGLHETVRREKISMCGFGPVTATIVAAKGLGARTAELAKYATSGEISGDFKHVVGYSGIVVR